MEGRVLVDAFTRLAKRDKIDRQSLELLQDKLLAYHKHEGFGFSLSLEGDLLSQWRGYADDGCGVSIGFSKSYLQELAKNNSKPGHDLLSLHEVIYDVEEHERLVRSLYDDYIRAMADRLIVDSKVESFLKKSDASEKTSRLASLSFSTVMATLFAFVWKAPAFKEEKEWRLLKRVDMEREWNIGERSKVKYAPKGDRMVPYVEYSLDEIEVIGPKMKPKPIKEVILGPKHRTPKHMVAQFLKSHGFNVHVEESAASYR
jgi:hypothetical protein